MHRFVWVLPPVFVYGSTTVVCSPVSVGVGVGGVAVVAGGGGGVGGCGGDGGGGGGVAIKPLVSIVHSGISVRLAHKLLKTT